MKKLVSSALVALFSVASFAATVNTEKTITVNGTTRKYILYVPDGVNANAPVVFSLHGASGHDTDYSPFGKDVADQKGCIVIYPQGLDQYFPVFGGTVTGWNSTGEANEELDFFKAVVDEVEKSYTVDRNRIYCCGFSNGGMMTYANANAACEFFAAFASISGFPLNEFHHRHTGARPVPFLHIHGKADDFVKYSCTPIIRANMVARMGCNPVPEVTTVNGKYTKSVYAAGEGSFPYVFYEVDGMGHTGWTDQTEDNNSSLTMWNFMRQYKLDTECDKSLKWRLNIDTEGFDFARNYWKANKAKTYFTFGTAKKANNADNNVYPTLQFVKGKYQLRMESTGNSGNKIYILVETMDGKKLFSKSAPVGKKVSMSFEVSELTNSTYSEYKMTILKESADDKFISLAIFQSDEKLAGYVEGTDCVMPDAPIEVETGKLVEIEQSQGKEYDNFTRTGLLEGKDFNTYTANGDFNIAIKLMNVDVKDCDYVIVKFAEAVSSGWSLAFWSGQDMVSVPAGSTEYKFELESTMMANGVLPQICLISNGGAYPLVAKVSGIYKHSTIDDSNPVHTINVDATPVAYYTMAGTMRQAPVHGINIVKMSDGTMRKMVIR